MCWCLRVYGAVLQNLFTRFYDHLADVFYTNDRQSCCNCMRQKCCCCCYRQECTQTNTPMNAQEERKEHEYVIVDDADANYIELEEHKIETESYYRTIDRATAELLLAARPDGACLVRPFKEADLSIKYVVSICARQQYFHLFIRQVDDRQLYAIGQRKAQERHFRTPSEIIEFYSINPLLCTNKHTSLCLVLRPIVA